MRVRILCIAAVVLGGLGWAAARPTHPGEAVPEEVAAAERGGDCYLRGCHAVEPWMCYEIDNSQCGAQTVLVNDLHGAAYSQSCSAYCGATAEDDSCTEYPTVLVLECVGG